MSKGNTSTKTLLARHWRLFSGMAIFAILLSQPLMAGAPKPDIPLPPKSKATKCVEDTEFMRKNHFELLLHQRDQTMHLGIRTKKHSLKECISCHVVEENGKPVSIASPKHFCRECHDYASVNIDCFECHASKPRMKKVSNQSMPSAMLPQTMAPGETAPAMAPAMNASEPAPSEPATSPSDASGSANSAEDTKGGAL